MKYLLLIYGDEASWSRMSADELGACCAAHEAFAAEMEQAGVLLGGEELQPTRSARTLRFGRGKPGVVDGPFAETREQLGGYYLIDTPSLDDALDWARRMPCMDSGAVEVRPVAMQT